ncbi:hypothetical protein Tcan_05486 [Toxocara canis]|uniref:Uncharacterized protein n=1 Tax=Toxocara canis TaxID=6265 RepID=A0A0B2VIL2_TOXCA|nr:hypothetical protein Tcan_05486 [Toxocara canis]
MISAAFSAALISTVLYVSIACQPQITSYSTAISTPTTAAIRQTISPTMLKSEAPKEAGSEVNVVDEVTVAEATAHSLNGKKQALDNDFTFDSSTKERTAITP